MKNTNLSKKEILERISFLRTKKNISAYKLGIELGHSKTYFYRIESGEIQLTMDLFLDILDVLNVTTSEFFCPYINEEDKQLLDNINSLSEKNKKTIIELIANLK
ncbi:MAG: helix-turn-helix domain-containing protein [Christensenellales bacterium]